jgi:hypothetical protein
MAFVPRRGLGLFLGLVILLFLLGVSVISVAQLGTAPVSPWILLWVLLPLASFPLALLVGYRLYGLLTARYWLDRDGFSLNWGLAFQQVPLPDLLPPQLAANVDASLRPGPGLWWPGCMVGERQVEGLGTVEFFATTGSASMVLLQAGDRILAISPPDVQTFLQGYNDSMRMGSLEPIAPFSQRPDFLFGRVWEHPLARVLILTGLALPLLLLGTLALWVPGLPSEVPFGFNAAGQPDPLAPPGRLLLLPLIGGLCWLADLVVGMWLFRQEKDRPLAFAAWGMAIAATGLLWGAAVQLMAAARGLSP